MKGISKRHRKHNKMLLPIKIPLTKEVLHTKTDRFFLNLSSTDRLSYTVQRNQANNIRTINNISYEIRVDKRWEWVVRYDDHGGLGSLHRHFRISLKNNADVESAINIKKYKNKNYQLTWCCKEVRKNYLIWRQKLFKKEGLDLY